MGRIYGKVDSPEDIRRINCIIRDEMLEVQAVEQLTDLKKRSDYLCTLTYSPFWLKKFGPMIEKLREVALEENRITVRLANYISAYNGWGKTYDPWGKDNKTIEERLKEIPEEIMKEIKEAVTDLKLSPEILEELRRDFCAIRKAMVLAESSELLTKLKRQADLIVAITHLKDFRERFEDILDRIDDIVNVEEERTVKLANIISEVNGWKITYEVWDESDVREDETLEQYVERLLEEEKKAQEYIPTEAKYKEGKVLWLVYHHPVRNREYAKRIYIPGTARNIKMEGPGKFKNRFGREVYGVRITYEANIRPTVIHIGGRVIHLPERWVKREKIVPIPEGAYDIRLVEERPEVAYPVA
ncbi:hypothetical protein [Desulfurobacterium sp.]|uniref:hypothetical protein n=1 Tax=Desulfurobacterium sp. TaxID=2004706 RepID=UPI00261836D7|nr:hypothetical protein [Desulfurobacterium sp.]